MMISIYLFIFYGVKNSVCGLLSLRFTLRARSCVRAPACYCVFNEEEDHRGLTVTLLTDRTRGCQTMADDQEIMCKLENILEIR